MKNLLFNLQEAELLRRDSQAALDSERSASERNRLGQFATPNELAVQIAKCISRDWPNHLNNVRFADPSIGSGSFFSAALSVFGMENIESGVGVELDERFVRVANEIWRDSGLCVIEGDFTQIIANGSRPDSPNLILANPPYVRHHHLDRGDKERLQSLVELSCKLEVSGLSGLYVYFLLLATEWMEEGGIAAWLIPSEFMDVNYGKVLREFFTERVVLDRIHRFDPKDVQFNDALVSSAIVFFRKLSPTHSHRVQFTFGGTLEQPAVEDVVSVEELKKSRKWSVYPSHQENDRRISTDRHQSTFSDFFKIQRGIATGCNKFFILDRDEARKRNLPTRYLRPILPSPRNLKTTIIEADEDGYPKLSPQLCLIDCDLSEREIQEHYPGLWEYLLTANTLGIKDGYLLKKRSPWYRQERREPAPFMCTYMGRGSAEKQPFRFIRNRSQAIGTNLYLMLTPQKSLAAMLRKHPERLDALHEVMGNIAGDELRGEGRVYGGGLNKIEPSELGRISALPIISLWPELGFATKKSETKSLFP